MTGFLNERKTAHTREWTPVTDSETPVAPRGERAALSGRSGCVALVGPFITQSEVAVDRKDAEI